MGARRLHRDLGMDELIFSEGYCLADHDSVNYLTSDWASRGQSSELQLLRHNFQVDILSDFQLSNAQNSLGIFFSRAAPLNSMTVTGLPLGSDFVPSSL